MWSAWGDQSCQRTLDCPLHSWSLPQELTVRTGQPSHSWCPPGSSLDWHQCVDCRASYLLCSGPFLPFQDPDRADALSCFLLEARLRISASCWDGPLMSPNFPLDCNVLKSLSFPSSPNITTLLSRELIDPVIVHNEKSKEVEIFHPFSSPVSCPGFPVCVCVCVIWACLCEHTHMCVCVECRGLNSIYLLLASSRPLRHGLLLILVPCLG